VITNTAIICIVLGVLLFLLAGKIDMDAPHDSNAPALVGLTGLALFCGGVLTLAALILRWVAGWAP